jgi:outer membrane protein W
MKTLAAALALVLLPVLAHAQPEDASEPADIAKPPPAPVVKAKRKTWYVRAGVAYVHPFSTSSELELADVDGPASLAVSNGPVPGSGASVESATIPALIIGYVLPVMDGKLALETILGPPLDVKFTATGTLANQSLAPSALGIPTGVPALGPELGEAKGVPPVITLVYSVPYGKLRPYVGAGISVLFAYNAHTTNPNLMSSDMSITPAPGLALQTGLEAQLYGRIYARLDVKFIALMYARAEVHHIQMQAPDIPLFGTVEVGTAKIGTWVNPLIVQAGIGTDF